MILSLVFPPSFTKKPSFLNSLCLAYSAALSDNHVSLFFMLAYCINLIGLFYHTALKEMNNNT